MEASRVVFLGGLTYFVYGFISWLSLGSFVPPIPFKPALFFLVTMIALIQAPTVPSRLRILFGTFILLYTLANTYFWEMFFGHQFMEQHVAGQLDIFLLFAVLMLVVFNFTYISASINQKNQRLLLNCAHILVLPFFFAWPSLTSLDLILVVLSLMHLLISSTTLFHRTPLLSPIFAFLLLLNALFIGVGWMV